MAVFSAVYFIRNNAGTYEAYDNEGTLLYSGTSLVTNVLNEIELDHNGVGGFAVLFGVGTFNMGTENWTINGEDDILVAGLGVDVTIIQNSSDAAADTEPFSHTMANRITYRDLTISAGGTARTSSDAIDFDNCSECVVERVKIADSRGRGIVFDGKDTAAAADRNVIRGCIVTGCRGGTTQAGSGILTLGGQSNTIEGNHVYDVTGHGIALQKASPTAGQPNKKSSHNTVRGNTVNNAGVHGIEVMASDHNVISGNEVTNSADDLANRDGICIETSDSQTAEGNVVVGNVCTDNQGTKTQRYGINLSSADVTNTLVEGNTLSGNLTAGLNNAGVGTTVRGNKGAPDNHSQSVNTATTLTFDDARTVLNVDSSAGTVAITLPSCATSSGRGFLVRRDGANAVTVTRAGSDTFSDAATTKTLASDEASIGIFSVGGTEWKIVATDGTVT